MKYFFMIPICLALAFSSIDLSGDCCDDYRDQCIADLCHFGFDPMDYMENFELYGGYSAGRSFGIDNNYGSFGFSYAPCVCPCSFGLILDGTYLTFDDGNYGASANLGFRFNNASDTIVSGMHATYEYREGDAGNFNQLGLKVEVIGNCFEVIANGYFPVGDKVQSKLDKVYDDYDNTGADTPYKVKVYDNEYALTGCDFEGGYKYCYYGITAYAGVGGYYFERKPYVENLWGVKGKLRVDCGKLFSLEGQVTWDDYNSTEGRVAVAINIPFSAFCNLREALCCPCNSQRRTSRDLPVHLGSCCKYVTNY